MADILQRLSKTKSRHASPKFGYKGDERLSSKQDQSDDHRSGADQASQLQQAAGNRTSTAASQNKTPEPRPTETGDGKNAKAPVNLGRALKTVYDDTLREDVPQDFLDLLGKLD